MAKSRRSRREQAERLLGPLEAHVADVFWDANGEELTVQAVLDAINSDRIEPYAYSTIMTVVVRLLEKGLLDRRRVGKAHAYRAILEPQDFLRERAERSARAMLAEYGDLALTGFVAAARTHPGQLAKLRELLKDDYETG